MDNYLTEAHIPGIKTKQLNMSYQIKVSFAFFLLVSLCGAASITNAQEIYRWVDEKGKMHFGDRPPNNQAAENITDSTKSANVDTSQSEQEKLGKLFAKETPEEKAFREEKVAQEKQRAQQLERRCTKAREDLRFFKEKRFYWVDEDGKQRDATIAERDETINNISEFLLNNC